MATPVNLASEKFPVRVAVARAAAVSVTLAGPLKVADVVSETLWRSRPLKVEVDSIWIS